MPYSTEIYKIAEQILEKRRDKAVMQADARAEEIKEKLPEVAEIQNCFFITATRTKRCANCVCKARHLLRSAQ